MTNIPEVPINKFHDLEIITWSLKRGLRIPEDLAFSIYESHWQYVTPELMTPEEKNFIEDLTDTMAMVSSCKQLDTDIMMKRSKL